MNSLLSRSAGAGRLSTISLSSGTPGERVRVRGQRTCIDTMFTFFENNSSKNQNVRKMKPYLPLTLALSPEYRGEGTMSIIAD